MRALAALLLSALLVAGCSGQQDDTDDPAGPAPGLNATADPRVIDASGMIAAGAGTPVASFSNGYTEQPFSVPANATLLYVELEWDSAAVALDLCIHAPADGDTQGVPNCGVVEDGGSPGMPAGRVTHTRRDPAAGDGWSVSPYVDGPAANVEFRLKATLFFNETAVPDGYTALG